MDLFNVLELFSDTSFTKQSDKNEVWGMNDFEIEKISWYYDLLWHTRYRQIQTLTGLKPRTQSRAFENHHYLIQPEFNLNS